MELAELQATDPAGLSPSALSDALVALDGQRRQLEALTLAYTARWDALEAWRESGGHSAKSWLVHNGTVNGATAGAQVRVARQLAKMPVVAGAVGELGLAKVRLLAVCQAAMGECFARDEAMLVDQARTLTVDQLARALEFWRRHANPDGSDPGDGEASNARVARYGSDRRRLVADLTPEDGAVVEGALERLAEELWRSATAPERKATSPAQRTAQALVEMAVRALGFDPEKQQPAKPSVVALMPLATLRGDDRTPALLARGGMISAQDAGRLACDAAITLALVKGSEVLNLGHTTRVPSLRQRLALALRDGGCVFPGCGRPASWCEAHHIQWIDQFGATNLANLCLLCKYHHLLIHRGAFALSRRPDGGLRFTDPDGNEIHTLYQGRTSPLDVLSPV